jgi:hypothetical protein
VIRNAVTGFDTIDIDVDGTAFLVAAGARISGPTSATAATDAIYLRTRDADAVIEGKIYATDQFYDLRESAGAGGIRHSLTTISPTTGANTGSLIGDNAYILLSDQSGGAVNLQSSFDLLRITAAASTPANAVDYDITVTNDKSLLLDAISASAGDIALTTSAVIFGFNVRADGAARRAIEREGVDLRYYSVIYDLIDDVKKALGGMLAPERREEILGVAEVRDTFRSPKFGTVAGCMVVEGTLHRNKPIRVLRENVVIFEGELESLRRFKDDVAEVRAGFECGIGVRNYNDVRVGDKIEVYSVREVARTL